MEMGGDFWKEDIEYKNNINEKFFTFGKDNKFLFSGRTAIDFILQDILRIQKIRNIYFPSYSCDSMTVPFKNRGIKIEYYDVYYDDGLKYNIDINFECDVFFAMNYFGYTSTNMERYIKEFKRRKVIVIEDFTQNLLSSKPFSNYSDYVIASLRKWFPVTTGGIATKLNDNFFIDTNNFTLNEDVTKIQRTSYD